jgi:sec-independent protein translocase protein TatA
MAYRSTQERNLLLVPGTCHLQGAHMRVGIPELLIVLAIVVLIFGANRLPELGRGIGKGIRNFKDATKDDSDKS